MRRDVLARKVAIYVEVEILGGVHEARIELNRWIEDAVSTVENDVPSHDQIDDVVPVEIPGNSELPEVPAQGDVTTQRLFRPVNPVLETSQPTMANLVTWLKRGRNRLP